MKKQDRLTVIEKFWKNKSRDLKWKKISWGLGMPLVGIDHETADEAHESLRVRGYAFWSMSLYEWEKPETFIWERALLDWLRMWHSLPEEWNTPLFINEPAWSVCIPGDATHHLVDLFRSPNSVRLGMEQWELANKEAESTGPVKFRKSIRTPSKRS